MEETKKLCKTKKEGMKKVLNKKVSTRNRERKIFC
jgi:hypothetical protein